MTLPNLPKVLNKREANWTTTVFRKWCEEKGITAVFEIKYTKKDYIAFSDVKDHQKQALLKVRYGAFVYKIPDMGERAPFDLFSFNKAPAYVVIRYPKGVAVIPIDVFLLEEKRSKRKSLTYGRAMELSTISFT